jgi:hypothetical protein
VIYSRRVFFSKRRAGWNLRRHKPAARSPDDLLLEAIDYVHLYRDCIEVGEDKLAPLYLEIALALIRDARAGIGSQLGR